MFCCILEHLIILYFVLLHIAQNFMLALTAVLFVSKLSFLLSFVHFLSNMKQRRKYLVCSNISCICSALHSKHRSAICGIKKKQLVEQSVKHWIFTLHCFPPFLTFTWLRMWEACIKASYIGCHWTIQIRNFGRKSTLLRNVGISNLIPPIPTQSFSFQMKNWSSFLFRTRHVLKVKRLITYSFLTEHD